MDTKTRIIVGVAAVTIAAVTTFVGYGYPHQWEFDLKTMLGDFYANLATDMLSIAIAVLVIDWLTQRRLTKEAKQELILQIGSTHPDVADEAVRKLRARGWLTDGTLKGAILRQAHLQDALAGSILESL